MFLYRVKVEDLDAGSLRALKSDLSNCEVTLRAQCPIREISVVAEDHAAELDIYLALDDFINMTQIGKLFHELRAMLSLNLEPRQGSHPRVSTEVIHV